MENATKAYVRLLDPDMKTIHIAHVVIFQSDEKTYNFCPIWRGGPNKLVPIMQDNEGKFYIDATDPFAYELFSAKSMEERYIEFNKLNEERDNTHVKILKEASSKDLSRARIPHFEHPDDEGKTPCIRMFL